MCCNNVIDLFKFVQVWFRFNENKTSLGIVQHTVIHIVLVQMFSLQDDQRALAAIRVCSHVPLVPLLVFFITSSVFAFHLVYYWFFIGVRGLNVIKVQIFCNCNCD